MTAREKFIARLKELGLYDEWLGCDHVGTVIGDGSVIVLIHVDSDDSDGYTEIHYPSFEKIRKDSVAKDRIKKEFYGYCDDDTFIAALAYWLDIDGEKFKCPLFPVDLYWAGVDCEFSFDFKDDPDDAFSLSIVEMVRYIAEKTGKEVNGIINGIKI